MERKDTILFVAREIDDEEAKGLILELEEYLKLMGYTIKDQIPISIKKHDIFIPYGDNTFVYNEYHYSLEECMVKYDNVLLLGFDEDVYKEYNELIKKINSVMYNNQGLRIRSFMADVYASWTIETFVSTFNKEDIMEKIDVMLDTFKDLKDSGEDEAFNNVKIAIKLLYESLNEMECQEINIP